jgi:hypothetical protein
LKAVQEILEDMSSLNNGDGVRMKSGGRFEELDHSELLDGGVLEAE